MNAAASALTAPVHFLDEETLLPLCGSGGGRVAWSWTRERKAVTCPDCKRLLAKDEPRD